MCQRIELYEKYAIEHEDGPDWESMGIASPKNQSQSYGYRRTMVMVDFIERPIEIPGNEKEFMVRFMSGEEMICLGSYDQFCISLHDIEEQMRIEDDLLAYEIEEMANQSNRGNG
jgi:hypothetical protein